MNGIEILIVEDEAIISADIESRLKRMGYGIAGIASRGEEAVKLALHDRPQLVLMDIQLSGPIDGIETAEEIKRSYNVPVVYLTAHSDPATLSRAKLTGPHGFVLKPIEDRELQTQIELAIYKHQSDKQMQEQREWLRVTLASIGEAVVAADTDGIVTFMNPVAEKLTGYSVNMAIGKQIEDVLHVIDEHTSAPLPNPMQNLLDTGLVSSPASQWLIVGADGKQVPVRISGAPIRDKDSHFHGLVIVLRDITQQRRSEKEKDSLIADLKDAAGKIKRLSGLLPICASCRMIRDDNGYWKQIEAFIKDHTEAEFSHGLCPDCAKKLYPEVYFKNAEGR